MQEEEPHDSIVPVLDHGYNQRGTIIFSMRNFREFANGHTDMIYKSDSVSIGGFSWKLAARILPQDGIQWLSLFLFCNPEGDLAKKDWSLKTACNFTIHSRLGDVGPLRSFYHNFSPGRIYRGTHTFIECQNLFEEVYGYITDDTVKIEAHVITNMPAGFCFETTNSMTIFKWPIFDFKTVATREDPNNTLNSNYFMLGHHRIHLRFDPTNINDNESKDFCSLWLFAENRLDKPLALNFKLWIENNDGKKCLDESSEFQTHVFNQERNHSGNSQFVHREKLYVPERKFMKNDFIFICCKARVVPAPNFDHILHLSEQEVQNKLSTLQGISGPCIIEVEGQGFTVEKSLLMAQSPVFESMFTSITTESQTNTVKIKDVASSTIQAFIEYMKGEAIGNFEKLSRPLFVFADRYFIDYLKIKCADFILQNVTKKNVIGLLFFAFTFGDQEFRRVVKEHFIRYYLDNNSKDAFESAEWKQVAKQNELLINEIMISLSS